MNVYQSNVLIRLGKKPCVAQKTNDQRRLATEKVESDRVERAN